VRTDLLIIGAGPFGLSLAAWAHDAGLDYVCLGTPMEFWRAHMPQGMYLRSGPDWHLDPAGVHTLERFLAISGSTSPAADTPVPLATPDASAPLSRTQYLAYAQWLQDQRGIVPHAGRVARVTPPTDSIDLFHVGLTDGRTIEARHVVVALGFGHFSHVPADLLTLVPQRCCAHTSDLVDFAGIAGKRFVIVGGRQSAFEWAALMQESGAASIDVVHRHPSPAFAAADWSWVTPLVAAIRADPGWYRRLSDDHRRAVDTRLWAEGRLKVEPWLAPRLATDTVRIRPGCSLVTCIERSDGALEIGLSNGELVSADGVVFATGYKVQIERVPFLYPLVASGALRTRNGFPELDDHFQTSIPNLFITSMPATQDFGPFLAFTVSACVSASLIGDAITSSPHFTG
jgi:FAD-dependent urate hydroxylase